MSLDNKVVLVTGGASGIGRATNRLAQDGVHVVVADVQVALADEVVRQVKSAGGSAEVCELNVAEEGAATAAVASIVETHGRLDGAFNNAGIVGPKTKLLEIDPSEWGQVCGEPDRSLQLCAGRDRANGPAGVRREYREYRLDLWLGGASSCDRIQRCEAWGGWSDKVSGAGVRAKKYSRQRGMSGLYRHTNAGPRCGCQSRGAGRRCAFRSLAPSGGSRGSCGRGGVVTVRTIQLCDRRRHAN